MLTNLVDYSFPHAVSVDYFPNGHAHTCTQTKRVINMHKKVFISSTEYRSIKYQRITWRIQYNVFFYTEHHINKVWVGFTKTAF